MTTNSVTPFVSAINKLAGGARDIRNANASMIARIVYAVRDTAGERSDVILANLEGDATATYGDVLALADGSLDKAKSSEMFDRLIGASDAGRAMLNKLATATATAAELEAKNKRAGLSERERANKADAVDTRDSLRKDRNAMVQNITRSARAACHVVERAFLRPADGERAFRSFTFNAHTFAITVEGIADVKAGKDGEPDVPVYAMLPFDATARANAFVSDVATWRKPEPVEPVKSATPADAPADAGTTPATTPADAPATADKREPHDNVPPVVKAIDAALADRAKAGAVRQALLARVLSMVAASYGTEPDNAPKGEERDALLALHLAIGALFTPAQIAAFERKEAAAAA